MPAASVDPALREGIAAARAGDLTRARELLLEVIAADERSEMAWLWLSGVVTTDEDRRVCLENVLAVNPHNAAARRGLARLAPPSAVDPLAALLEPEIVAAAARRAANLGWQPESAFADVWESGEALCPYCAAVLAGAAPACPACGRKLSGARYRYPRAGSDLLIYVLLLVGVVNLYVVQIIVGFIARVPLATLLWQGVLGAWVAVTLVFVHLRRFWAYLASLVTLLFLTLAALLGWLVPVSAQPLDLTGAGLVGLLAAVGAEPYRVVATPLLDVFWLLQVVAMVLALLYGILRVGPDFERVQLFATAEVEKGQRDPSRLYAIGREHADQGRWASAVLNWRLAAALDPGRAYYQRALGEAYARLGFYERGLDVLESARRLTGQPDSRAEVDRLIDWVSRQAAVDQSAGAPQAPGSVKAP